MCTVLQARFAKQKQQINTGDRLLMLGENQDAGLPELKNCEGLKSSAVENKTATKLKGPIQDLRKAADGIEGLARSLKANQRRSQFHTIE